MRGSDIDNAAPIAWPHLRNDGTHGVKVCGEIDCYYCVPSIDGKRFYWRRMLDTSIVNKNVDPAELACRKFDHAHNFCRLCQVCTIECCTDGEVACDQRPFSFDLLWLSEAVQNNVASGLRQRSCNTKADAARGACYERRFIV